MRPPGCLSAWLLFLIGALALSTLAATSEVHPIVDAKSGYLLGGSKDGQWLDDKKTAKELKGGETYQVYGNSTRAGQTSGSKPRSGEAPCDETHWVTLKKNFNGVLGVSADWQLVPRNPRPQSVHQKYYRNEVARILQAHKIKKPKVIISQLWRVDLDGDKVEEVLLSATHYANPDRITPAPNYVSASARAGDYSLVLLRKVVRGKVKTIPLVQEIYFQNKEFSAPSIHALAGVYDLNGDGKMEVVLDGSYYEGAWKTVYEITGDKAKPVLSAGCGA